MISLIFMRVIFENISSGFQNLVLLNSLDGFDIEDAFSYFPGMFENPEPAVKTSCKRNINIKKFGCNI